MAAVIREGLGTFPEAPAAFNRDLFALRAAAIARLREPFLPHEVGKKPQPYQKDAPKSWCNVCSQKHGMPALHLDYVGHAHVTDRLLEVDPDYEFGPLAHDKDSGEPVVDRDRNGNPIGMWCKLTILGMTKVEYAEGDGGKELMSDGIRRCAMRFGCGLDHWKREASRRDDRDDGGGEQRDRGPDGASTAAAPSSWKDLGWPSKEEANRRHTEVSALLSALPEGAQHQLRSFRQGKGLLGWPLSMADLAEVETWASEWKAASEPFEPAG